LSVGARGAPSTEAKTWGVGDSGRRGRKQDATAGAWVKTWGVRVKLCMLGLGTKLGVNSNTVMHTELGAGVGCARPPRRERGTECGTRMEHMS
jgi:hypothetical protein